MELNRNVGKLSMIYERIKQVKLMLKSGTIIDYIKYRFRRKSVMKKNRKLSYQHKQLKQLLRYAVVHCDYYQMFKITIDSWEDIKKFPFLTKHKIKNYRECLVSNRRDRLLSFTARTGGSTGEPLEFLNVPGIDDLFQEKVWISNGYKKGDVILALDGASVDNKQIENGKYLYHKSHNQMPYGGYGLSSLYLTENNIACYIKIILELQPAFIRGYPSFVYRIAKYILDNNILLNFKMKAVELTSESSFMYQHDVIRKAFCCHIIMQYGHTECCAFGYTFDFSMRYRFEPLYGYVEVIKENGEDAQVGEIGEIVVTSLYNYVMPLVRYKTGDYAIYGGMDDDGIILDRILGRTQDYIVNRYGDKILLTALIFAQHQFCALAHIDRWQIEQFYIGSIILHIVKGKGYDSEDEKEIKDVFDRFGQTEVHFDYCDDIGLTIRGKTMLLNQHLTV